MSALLCACGGEDVPGTTAADEPSFDDEAWDGGRDVLFAAPETRIPWHEDNRRRRDPATDGWRTEVLNDLAKPVLHDFLEELVHDAADDPGRFDAYLAPDFESSTELRPEELETVFDEGGTIVRRGEPGDGRHPRASLPALARGLRAPFGGEPHPHSKIVSVEPRGEAAFETLVVAYIDGAGDGGRVQQNLELRIGWRIAADGSDGAESVRIASVEVVSFEEVASPDTLFHDVSHRVFAEVPRYRDELLRGVPEWYQRTDFFLIGNSLPGMHGLAVADVDGDGRDDVYLPQQGGLPNRLFLHRDDGGVEDATESSGLGFLDETRSALFCDLDDDGDQDAALGVGSVTLLAYNDGDARFTEFVPLRPETLQDVYSMCAADPDRDGDLDLYATRYEGRDNLNPVPIPYHDANNGAANVYWRNGGDRRFENATVEVGLDENNRKFSYAAIWEDLDLDGDLDLYVANDFGRNNLYRNEGERFRDVAAEVGALDKSSGMGVTAGDFDGDGDFDLYVSNMFSSAGNRIVPQAELYMGGEHPELEGTYRHFARGNTLLANQGDGTFVDVTEDARVGISGWAWASMFVDFNNDGHLDVYSPNGYITNYDTDDT